MKWVIAIAVFFALAAIYANWIRPWLRDKPWAQPFFDWIEPIERVLWWKSETIFMARVKMLTGLLLTALTQAGSIDITPLMPLIPDQYEGLVTFAWNLLPMTITILGWLDQKQRFDTTKPLEIVAMRTDAPEEVKAAAADAEAVMKEAVVEIKTAEAV